MYALSTQARPAKIGDIIKTDSADPLAYDAQTGWFDLGATREGIQITVNNTEDSFDVDQVLGEILTTPNAWTGTLATRLAEMTFEHLQLAWEGAAITSNTITADTTNKVIAGTERQLGFAGATSYTERRLAVLFQRPNGKLQAYTVHRAVRAPQDTTLDFRKSGDAMTIAVQFRMLQDATVTDPKAGLGYIFEQT
jgi:hypothetical protein